MIGIVLADNSEMVREGIASLLNKVPDFNVVSQCSDGHELIDSVTSLCPTIAVVDTSLPELSSIDAARRIGLASPTTRVIAISSNPNNFNLAEMTRVGIVGYVPKSGTVNELITAIRQGSKNKIYVSETAAERLRSTISGRFKNGTVPAPVSLTPRETEILILIAEGNSSRTIATRLHISENTVKTHRNHLMDKLSVRDVAGLTREAFRLKLIHIE
jgi:DNA-binding NarL/FixJ family response regulator